MTVIVPVAQRQRRRRREEITVQRVLEVGAGGLAERARDLVLENERLATLGASLLLASLPAAIGIGQPIGHRIDHMLSGVRSQIAIKIFGDDLDTLRAQAESLRQQLAKIGGVVDLEIEKQVLTPQIKVQVDYDRNTNDAIAANVFGAPWYVYKGEGFWGQDRLDFLEREFAR